MLQGEEEVRQIPDVVGMEVADKKVTESIPCQPQPGRGTDRSRAAVQKEAKPGSLDPVGRAPPGRIRKQGPGPQDVDPHGQNTTLLTSTTPPACKRSR